MTFPSMSDHTTKQENNGFVYKRRKFLRNGVALLKESEKSQDQTPNDLKDRVCSSSNLENCDLGPSKNTNKEILSNSPKHAQIKKDQPPNCAEIKKTRSSRHFKAKKELAPRELCISMLETQWENNGRKEVSRKCKICKILEDSRKMLICDGCEEAYHLSCSSGRGGVKKAEKGNWFCLSCSGGRKVVPPKILEERTEKSNKKNGKCTKPIRDMLSDKWPRTVGVNIGRDFQAEIPDWSGPIENDSSPYPEPERIQLDLEKTSTSNLWRNKPKSKSVGNWVQCQEIIHTNDNGGETICGKWRRVPYCVEQTDDWDCSYVLPYDQFHADCAVPQEVENDVVYEQLKYSHKFQKLLETRTRNPRNGE